MGQQAESRFLITSFCYLFVSFAIALDAAASHERNRYVIVSMLFVICILIQGFSIVYADALLFHRGEKTVAEVTAKWLVENGYHEGVSSVEDGSDLVYISNGKLDMWHVGTYETEDSRTALGPYEWEQAKYHCERLPEDHPFLLVQDADGEKYDFLTAGHEPVWEYEGNKIYDISFD